MTDAVTAGLDAITVGARGNRRQTGGARPQFGGRAESDHGTIGGRRRVGHLQPDLRPLGDLLGQHLSGFLLR